MNRRTAWTLAGGCGLYQVLWVTVLPPVLTDLWRAGIFAGAGLRLVGLRDDVGESLAPRFDTAAGWLPHLLLLVLSVVSAYGVFRTAAGRLRTATVGAFGGAVLLAAGSAELLARALDTSQRRPGQPYTEWFVEVQLQGTTPSFALIGLWTGATTVLFWTELRILRRVTPLRKVFGGMEEEQEETAEAGTGTGPRRAGAGSVPTARAREQRDAVTAGLIPVVLLALAGGLLLRHNNVHTTSQPSVTFDPESALPYQPPPLADAWAGVLYPSLRMRPLPTENTGGWLATLAVCLVLLAVLALALRAVVRGAGRVGGRTVFLRCWYATVLAAAVAALVEGTLSQGPAPIPSAADLVGSLGQALADAVRFGTVCGWVTGAAVLGAVALRRSAERHVEKGESSDAG